jgi:hypothetical protein
MVLGKMENYHSAIFCSVFANALGDFKYKVSFRCGH